MLRRVRELAVGLLPVERVTDELQRRLHRTTSLFRTHSPIFVLHSCRTWNDARATSCRGQSGTSGCVWACSPVATDSLRHYLSSCEVLWAEICCTLGMAMSHWERIGMERSRLVGHHGRSSPSD